MRIGSTGVLAEDKLIVASWLKGEFIDVTASKKHAILS